ncbi:hypothetical protein, partial [Methylobacterium gnaphalii]|uniref:hypothetical protein n=1 Tax=Methylobacterium gnaphalii TaxID=1010610 RepID=UPI0024E0E65E
PWGAIGVMQVGVIALGGVLYWPIRENQSDFKDALRELKTTMISRSDVDYKFSVTGQRRDDFQRMSEQRDKEMDGKIEQIRDRIVPRSEQEEKWRGNEQRFNDMQRQVDDQKRAFGDTFSLRDALQQMQKRIDTLETIRTAR